MGKRKVNQDERYQTWLSGAEKLTPPYDYFSFADIAGQSEAFTNSAYSNLLSCALATVNKSTVSDVVAAISLFKGRNHVASKFFEDYDTYWQGRSLNDSRKSLCDKSSSIIENVREDLMERVQKRLKPNGNGSGASSDTGRSSTSDENTDSSSISGENTSNLNISDKNTNNCSNNKNTNSSEPTTDHEETEDVPAMMIQNTQVEHKCITGIPILNIDDGKGHGLLDEGLLLALKDQTNLLDYQVSEKAADLMATLAGCANSTTDMRAKPRHFIGGFTDLDTNVHVDVAFLEIVATYYLNLIDSPNKPLMLKELERTCAIHSTIFILNNLFLAANDLVEFRWYEDGIGFAVANKKVTPVLVEFSGGQEFSNYEAKANTDLTKLIPGAIKAIEYTCASANIQLPIPEFVVRFYDNKIHFESIIKISHDSHIQRTYFSIDTPKTPRLLKALIEKVPPLFAWRQAVIDFVLAVNGNN
ncbi:hypothetical protein DFQ28_002122 [Apophysomyces sp. BC1034]|nr:hypothetical protein DFQ30_010351 [Apophysomyces sp. BC1015]KAG0183553.1 hypothetical protein DFQ29_002608 [Apophysomyces sp. BC1021]KAG0194013.1 hypothetical protein DFQ28_002122 [Apophysomyces sp. BC1034]